MTNKIRVNQICVFNATGWDLVDRKANTPENGTVVRTIKSPAGCPPAGTMGHIYVGDRETGRFIGLVSLASLTPLSEVISKLKAQVAQLEQA